MFPNTSSAAANDEKSGTYYEYVTAIIAGLASFIAVILLCVIFMPTQVNDIEYQVYSPIAFFGLLCGVTGSVMPLFMDDLKAKLKKAAALNMVALVVATTCWSVVCIGWFSTTDVHSADFFALLVALMYGLSIGSKAKANIHSSPELESVIVV